MQFTEQRLPLKPKYFENFGNYTKRMLEEKSNVLPWIVDKVPFLRNLESCCTAVVDYRKAILRAYNLEEVAVNVFNEVLNFEK